MCCLMAGRVAALMLNVNGSCGFASDLESLDYRAPELHLRDLQ